MCRRREANVVSDMIQQNGEPQVPKIEFPCAYPLKIVGNAADDFQVFVADVLAKHTGESFHERIEIVSSSTGRFLSARVTITATGVDQLKAIFEDFKASGRIHTVL
jgi:putative lipoic acid-binding regulatory protein